MRLTAAPPNPASPIMLKTEDAVVGEEEVVNAHQIFSEEVGEEHGGEESKKGDCKGYAKLDHALALDGRDCGDAGYDVSGHQCCGVVLVLMG